MREMTAKRRIVVELVICEVNISDHLSIQGLKKLAQNGRGIERATGRASGYRLPVVARIRTLCALRIPFPTKGSKRADGRARCIGACQRQITARHQQLPVRIEQVR